MKEEDKDAGPAAGGSKKPKAMGGGFDDFFGGDDDDDDDFDLMGDGLIDFAQMKPGQLKKADKKDEKKEEPAAKSADANNQQPALDQQFMAIKDELLKSVALFSIDGDLQSAELLRFILLFASVYNKDFFSDEMASTLLRQVYLETEGVDEEKLKEL